MIMTIKEAVESELETAHAEYAAARERLKVAKRLWAKLNTDKQYEKYAKQRMLDYMKRENRPVRAQETAIAVGATANHVYQIFCELLVSGQVVRISRGLYAQASWRADDH